LFTNIAKISFKGNPYVAKAFATIPSVNMWDDHVSEYIIFNNKYSFLYIKHKDIIDGYGSYPPEMQNADCFKGK
jgi:hypothetical protein